MGKIGKILIKGPMRLLGKLPLKVQYWNAGLVAFLAGSVFNYRRDDVMVNLARSFPDKKYKELRRIKKEFYRHFGDLVAETLWFGASDERRIRKQDIAHVVNPEEFQQVFDNAKSVVNLYSHCGNWELFGGIEYYFPKDNSPVHEDNCVVVYKEMTSKVWDQLLKENRLAPLGNPKSFEGYVESNDIVRFIFNHKDRKMVYNFNTDQSPYIYSGANLDIDFMHQRTKTMTAAAALAHKFGFAVCYMSMPSVSRGHYEIRYELICQDASQMSVADIMDRYYRHLERDLNSQPWNYLWTHRRWKLKV